MEDDINIDKVSEEEEQGYQERSLGRTFDKFVIKKSERIIKHEAKKLAAKLKIEIERGNATSVFMFALCVAVFKDFIIDLIEEIPEVGWILGFILGVFASALLMYLLWGTGYFNKYKARILWFILGLIITDLPIFSILPESIVLVLWSWHVVRKRAANARAKLDKLHQMTDLQIEKLNKNIYLLDEEDENDSIKSGAGIEDARRTQLQAKLFTAYERRAKIEAFQEKRGYANLNTNRKFYQKKYKFNDII